MTYHVHSFGTAKQSSCTYTHVSCKVLDATDPDNIVDADEQYLTYLMADGVYFDIDLTIEGKDEDSVHTYQSVCTFEDTDGIEFD